jgi:hypothetical protein
VIEIVDVTGVGSVCKDDGVVDGVGASKLGVLVAGDVVSICSVVVGTAIVVEGEGVGSGVVCSR